MLTEIEDDLEFKTAEVERLKAQGKEKSATFKQYLADKLLYQRMLSIYELYPSTINSTFRSVRNRHFAQTCRLA